jgi:hypothetical protein
MKDLIKQLSFLKKEFNIAGIKQSFEDEGVSYDDVVTMRRITELCDLPLFVKIGGCEAKTDIRNCINLGVDAVVAPMIETPFALSKFLGAVGENAPIKTLFLCESITAYNNLDAIFSLEQSNRLTGIIFGRSDFAKSLGLNKSEVDTLDVCSYVETVLEAAKKRKLITTIGGNISTKSSCFIKKMFEAKLLNRIETRNMIIELSKKNISNLKEAIRQALDFEINWLRYNSRSYATLSDEYIYRAGLLESRK